jgi:undecaprenyl-diphosphatase
VSWLEAVFLGFLQGATEFLPVSSSGHLVMGQELLGLTLPGITFEVAVHVATLVSVVVVYRERLLGLVRGTLVERDGDSWRYVGLLAAATVPVAVVGLTLGDRVEALFETPAAVGAALLFTGTLLISTRWALRRAGSPRIGLRVALLIGLAQCLALAPGVSRSGTTVTAALWLGVSPVEAAAFSFLLSIPAIAGAALLETPGMTEAASEIGAGPLLVASVVAGVTGILAIRLFVAMLRNRSFPFFAWYCWGVGLLFLAWVTLR